MLCTLALRLSKSLFERPALRREEDVEEDDDDDGGGGVEPSVVEAVRGLFLCMFCSRVDEAGEEDVGGGDMARAAARRDVWSEGGGENGEEEDPEVEEEREFGSWILAELWGVLRPSVDVPDWRDVWDEEEGDEEDERSGVEEAAEDDEDEEGDEEEGDEPNSWLG
jgi:hypothetical protein